MSIFNPYEVETKPKSFPQFDHKQRGDIKHQICLDIAKEFHHRGYRHSLFKREVFTWLETKVDKTCLCSDGRGNFYTEHHISLENTPDHCNYRVVEDLIDKWASGSSFAIQATAKHALINRINVDKLKGINRDWYHIVKIIYDKTQESFKREGKRYLKLYRGVHNQCYTLKPLSSFSVSWEVARRFVNEHYGQILEVSIPVRFIASTYYTGYGCAQEYEYVVLGMGEAVRHLKVVYKGKAYA